MVPKRCFSRAVPSRETYWIGAPVKHTGLDGRKLHPRCLWGNRYFYNLCAFTRILPADVYELTVHRAATSALPSVFSRDSCERSLSFLSVRFTAGDGFAARTRRCRPIAQTHAQRTRLHPTSHETDPAARHFLLWRPCQPGGSCRRKTTAHSSTAGLVVETAVPSKWLAICGRRCRCGQTTKQQSCFVLRCPRFLDPNIYAAVCRGCCCWLRSLTSFPPSHPCLVGLTTPPPRPPDTARQTGTSTPVSSTSFDKMKQDKRYTPANKVPDEVLSAMGSDEIFSPGFSIKGQALAGRASYLVSEGLTD